MVGALQGLDSGVGPVGRELLSGVGWAELVVLGDQQVLGKLSVGRGK